MKKLTIQSSVDLYIGRGLKTLISDVCETLGTRAAVIVDPAISHFGETFLAPTKKTREAKQQLEDQILQAGFGRDSVFVAIGGGTTTDLVGFLAATYMRGVPLVLVPTTLLGMVDAAIGGKTAVDTPFGKNLIGTFYLPKAIIVDLDYLLTLPEKELINGRSEIVKMALIYDPSILQQNLEEQIIRAILAKIAIVEQDPKEIGLRRMLNFGHTIGHAIELCAEYSVSHGEAVALGCVAESYLSLLMGFLPQNEFDQIVQLFPKFRWNYKREAILKAMTLDKKSSKGAIRFVLIDQIGRAIPFDGAYCCEVPEEKIIAALKFMEETYA